MVPLHSPPKSLATVLALAGACLLLAAPAATAASVQAPPGNSGVVEYVESIPDGSGDRVGTGLYHGRATVLTTGSGLLRRSSGQRLANIGHDGAMAAALASAG